MSWWGYFWQPLLLFMINSTSSSVPAKWIPCSKLLRWMWGWGSWPWAKYRPNSLPVEARMISHPEVYLSNWNENETFFGVVFEEHKKTYFELKMPRLDDKWSLTLSVDLRMRPYLASSGLHMRIASTLNETMTKKRPTEDYSKERSHCHFAFQKQLESFLKSRKTKRDFCSPLLLKKFWPRNLEKMTLLYFSPYSGSYRIFTRPLSSVTLCTHCIRILYKNVSFIGRKWENYTVL